MSPAGYAALMSRRHVPIALTIAGSDPSGGAGLQADLKTFHQHGVYGASVVTLLTVQSTQRVSRVDVMSPELVAAQLDAVREDLDVAAIKTGALGSAAVVRAVAKSLGERPALPCVVDPVMVSKHGHALLDADAVEACMTELFPRATLVTPNVPEAERMLGLAIDTDTLEDAAAALARKLGVAVLLKGGHLAGGDSVDVLVAHGTLTRFSSPRIDSPHTHGTGCTFSSAITARLAGGVSLTDAIAGAKRWLTRAIEHAPAIGRGIGPVDHLEPL